MRQAQQAAHRQSLEAGRLLKGVADAQSRSLRHAQIRDVLSVVENLAACRLFDAHDDACERRFAAAVRTRDHQKTVLLKGKRHVIQDAQLPLVVLYLKMYMLQF